jgi:hypothetical protein
MRHRMLRQGSELLGPVVVLLLPLGYDAMRARVLQ